MTFARAFLLALCAIAWNAHATLKTENGNVLPVTLTDYNLQAILEDLARLTDMNIVYPSDMFVPQEKVHLVLSSPVSKEEFRKIVYHLLSGRGYTPIEEYGAVWIYNARDIRYLPTPISQKIDFPADARYRTMVYRLKNPTSSIIARNLRPVMSRYGRVIDFSDARTLIINDTSDNIIRLVKTVEFLDTEAMFKNFVNDVPKKDPNIIDPMAEKIVQLELEKKILEKKYTELKNQNGLQP